MMNHPFSSQFNDTPRVTILKAESFNHTDSRRVLSGLCAIPDLPISLCQLKLIEFSSSKDLDKSIVGNHKHRGVSGQWEVVLVLGDPNTPQFEFRYRNYNSATQTAFLNGGYVVAVPPGCSLALKPLFKTSKLIEVSNQTYRSDNYIEDILF